MTEPTTPPPEPPANGGYPPPPPPQFGQQPPAYPMGAGVSQLNPADERTWGMLAHLSAIIASFVGMTFLGPLLVMLIQGPKSPFVRRQAVEALNFQITTYIALLVSAILVIVLIGLFMLAAVGIAWLVLSIMASVAANRGEDYRYPLNIRLVS